MISWEQLPNAISIYINEMQLMRGSIDYADAKNCFLFRMSEIMTNKEEITLLPQLIECVEKYTDISTAY